MEPRQFIDKWRASERPEQAAAQPHFLDLCALLDVPKPGEAGLGPADYDFERRVRKPDGRVGRADVWRRGCFAWEYKGPGRSLAKAYSQLKEYADALDNPPLLIVSDTREIRVHTNFTNAVKEEWAIPIADLAIPEVRARLRKAWTDAGSFRPTVTRERVTRQAAVAFGELARVLRERNYEPRRVAHFLNKLVFCLFAEDIELLPDRVFAELLEAAQANAEDFEPMLRDLFRAMQKRQGRFGSTRIPWFNGGLFDDDDVLPLNSNQIRDLAEAARLDWSAIEPSIFGTLFERGLDPAKRKQMASLFEAKDAEAPAPQPGLFDRSRPDKGVGIHYTDEATIMKIVEPVVLRPLRREWEAVKAAVAERRAAKAKAKSTGAQTKAEEEARDAWLAFRKRLGAYRVLDPACGSGAFLYIALRELKDFDLAVMREGEALGLPADGQRVGPEALLGIEINPYAAELARVTVWIGELQWQLKNGFGVKREPILGQLRGIECRDALLNQDGSEAAWPMADAIVGNPPFLGDKLMIAALGEEYTYRLRSAYSGKIPGGADLVAYWFYKLGIQLHGASARTGGLVATQSIRRGASRKVVEGVSRDATLFEAWSDEPWGVDGAAVRVSLLCWHRELDFPNSKRLDGNEVEDITPALSASRLSLSPEPSSAKPLPENAGVAFQGVIKTGAFDIEGGLARQWLLLPVNPNGRTNADVLRPLRNANDLVRRSSDRWIIDFPIGMTESEAAFYEVPFKHILKHVKLGRAKKREKSAHIRTAFCRSTTRRRRS